MNKKRLLIATGIFAPDIGGPATYAQSMGLGLSDEYEVTIITYSTLSSYPDDAGKPYRVLRVGRGIPKPLRQLWYLRKLWREGKKADLIYSLSAFGAGLPAAWVARRFKKPFFVRIAGDSVWEKAVNDGKTTLLINDFQKAPRFGWLGKMHKIQTWVCRAAIRIAVPSEYLSELVQGWGIDQAKIMIVHNSVEPVSSGLTTEEARKEVAIAGKIIISIGRLVTWKGFRMLIKIMPQLLQINQFFRLIIIGEGPDRPVLESIIKNLNLQNKVFLLGKKSQEEIIRYLRASDIFILNTGYEGFSHQLISTMAQGVPVITTSVGGNKEIIRQGENGFMVKYNDEFNLIEAVKTLWQDPQLREQFIEEGKKTAAAYPLERTIRETKALLTTI